MATRIYGTDGSDIIRQNSTPFVTVYAYGGNDTIYLTLGGRNGGFNTVYGDAGNDRVYNSFEGGNDIFLGTGDDRYVGTGFSTASSYYDVVKGGAGNDTFDVSTFHSDYYGESGNDTFFSVGFNNLFNGGSGTDTISFESQDDDGDLSGTGIYVDLYEGFARSTSSYRETLVSIENAAGTGTNDTLLGSDVANRLWGDSGNDVLKGFAGNDRLYGENGNDNLSGGSGNDQITGGTGTDTLIGGSGADRFIFTAINQSVNGSRRDVITDFRASEGDLIDLSGIDADYTRSGNQAFDFIGRESFSGEAGELRFSGGILSGDVNGDGAGDFQIAVSGHSTLYSDDFIA